MGNYGDAVVYCNKSLCLRRDDQFTITVLQEAVEREGEEELVLAGFQAGTMDDESDLAQVCSLRGEGVEEGEEFALETIAGGYINGSDTAMTVG